MTTVLKIATKACVGGAGDVEAIAKSAKDGAAAGVGGATSDEASCAEEEGEAD